jgi:hypothetical protein
MGLNFHLSFIIFITQVFWNYVVEDLYALNYWIFILFFFHSWFRLHIFFVVPIFLVDIFLGNVGTTLSSMCLCFCLCLHILFLIFGSAHWSVTCRPPLLGHSPTRTGIVALDPSFACFTLLKISFTLGELVYLMERFKLFRLKQVFWCLGCGHLT